MVNDPKQRKRSSEKKDSGAKKKRTTAETPPRRSTYLPPPNPHFDYSKVPRNRLTFITAMRASLAMLNVLEEQYEKGPFEPEPPFQNPPDDSLDENKLADLAQKIEDMEHKVRMVSRRLNECRRGQMILMERVEELQNSMHKSQQLNVVKELLYIIPTEKELSMLQRMKEIEAKRNEKNREIRNQEKQNKVLSKTLGRAEAIITDTAVLKRPKRVVIVEDEFIHFRTDDEKTTKFTASYARKMDGVYYKGIRRVARGPYFGEDEDDEGGSEISKEEVEEYDDVSADNYEDVEDLSKKVLDEQTLENEMKKILLKEENNLNENEKFGHSSKDYKSEFDDLEENEAEMSKYVHSNLHDNEKLGHSSKDYKSEFDGLEENEPEMTKYIQNNVNDNEKLGHSSKDYKSEFDDLEENKPEMTKYIQNNLNDNEKFGHSSKDYKSVFDDLEENEPKNELSPTYISKEMESTADHLESNESTESECKTKDNISSKRE